MSCSICTELGEVDVRFELEIKVCVSALTDGCVSFQRYPTDKAYFIAKEILATERTYLKDLEVITVVSGLDFFSFPFFKQICDC